MSSKVNEIDVSFAKRKSNPGLMTRFISINGLQNLVENSDQALIVKSKLFIDELN